MTAEFVSGKHYIYSIPRLNLPMGSAKTSQARLLQPGHARRFPSPPSLMEERVRERRHLSSAKPLSFVLPRLASIRVDSRFKMRDVNGRLLTRIDVYELNENPTQSDRIQPNPSQSNRIKPVSRDRIADWYMENEKTNPSFSASFSDSID
jgi:hypothetical protein